MKPPVQTELFGVATAVTPATVHSDPCPQCGSTVGVEGPGAGPHWKSLRCIRGHFIRWLPRPQGQSEGGRP